MRSIVIGVVGLLACKGDKPKEAPGSGSQAQKPSGSGSGSANAPTKDALAAHVPKVAAPAALAAPTADDRVPLLVLVDEDGKLDVAVGPSKWAELGGFQIATRKPTDLRMLDVLLHEGVALGRTPAQIFEGWGEPGDLALEEDTTARTHTTAQDDPPPPEEEEKPDDGADESGGTGTAMQLDEGKMGKKDSDRAEGQYKMKKNQEDPQLARQQAIEQARAAGILGSKALRAGGAFASLTGTGTIGDGDGGADYPSELGTVSGNVAEDGKLAPETRAMIAAHPKAKAQALIDVIAATNGAILVAQGTDVRPLRLQFPRQRDVANADSGHWIEVRATATELVVEAVPDVPTTVAQPTELAAAYTKALATPGFKDAVVDVLVASDVDAQRLIDVLVALDAAGARSIGLGTAPVPGDAQSKLRGKPIHRTAIGNPSSLGNLDKVEIRHVIKRAQPQLSACYEAALLKKPDLAGTVMAQFMIGASGKVTAATASGLDPEVAACVTKVIKSLTFPKATNGGNTQVNYPFSFRPS